MLDSFDVIKVNAEILKTSVADLAGQPAKAEYLDADRFTFVHQKFDVRVCGWRCNIRAVAR
jgi:hypothetical protein